MNHSHTYLSMLVAAVAAASLGMAPPNSSGGGNGGGGGGGGSTSGSGGSTNGAPLIHITTPGASDPRNAVDRDVLVDRIEFADGTEVSNLDFVYPGQVLGLTYDGPLGRFRVMNGQYATVGRTGVHYIEAEDLNATNITAVDRDSFCNKIGEALGNNNINNRVHLQSQTGYSFIVSLSTRVWDSHFAIDQRPEIFIFEEQGNSVMTIQPLDDNLQIIGTPVEIRAVDIVSIQPAKTWVGRWGNDGQPQSGTYEAKYVAIDLTRLGVSSLKYFRLSTSISGGGEQSADFKIIAVDTSPARAAQTLTFD
jgi:hypothetical protein